MAESNPVNNERIVSTEWQLQQWVEGNSIHNGLDRRSGECCPDFSCCHPDLMLPLEKRRQRAAEILARLT